MKFWENNSKGIIPFSIPQGSPIEKLKNIRKEFSNFKKDVDYSVSTNGNEYFIFSEELKIRLRLEIWEKTFDEYKRDEHGGEYCENSYFFYKEGEVNSDPDTFKIKKDKTDLTKIQGVNSPQIMEIDDEEAEKIRQENLEKEKKQKEVAEMTKVESSTNLDSKIDKGIESMKTNDKSSASHEKDNNYKSGGIVSKYTLPFIGVGLFSFIVGVVLAIKP